MAQPLTLTLFLVAAFYTLPSANSVGPCGPGCDVPCRLPYDDVRDVHGCPTCECILPSERPPTTPLPPSTATCPSGSSPVPSRTCGSSLTSRTFSQRCPRGSFCLPDFADGSGICCELSGQVDPGWCPQCENFCQKYIYDVHGCSTCECDLVPVAPPPPPQEPTCPLGSSPAVTSRRCSAIGMRRRFRQRCPGRSFCVPDSADGSGTCCQLPVGCRPERLRGRQRCSGISDMCNSDDDCARIFRGVSRCCMGPCGKRCQLPFSGRQRGRRD